jgi:hypothetical protein
MKLITYLYLTGFAVCAILWAIALWTVVVLVRDELKQKYANNNETTGCD